MALSVLPVRETRPTGERAPDRSCHQPTMKNTQLGFEKCLPFINSQFQPAGSPPDSTAGEVPRLAVTISRQTGSGALAVGEKLAAYLEARVPRDLLPWRVFDRNLVSCHYHGHFDIFIFF